MIRTRAGRGGWGIALLWAISLACATGVAWSETPELPRVSTVPPSEAPPLSSAERKGTEYADLASAGYVEQELYMSGVAPAITAQGKILFDAPYVTRILVRKPRDPARFNGTVVIEPFTWIGERGAGWILTKDYLLRKGYAEVAYTLSINKPQKDPKTRTDPNWMPDPEPANLNLDFMRRFDYARYAPLGFYYDPSRFTRGDHADPFAPQSQGVGAQLALLLKSNRPDGPLPGLRVERVYVNSWAVTAQVWMDYLDQGRHQQWRMPDGRPLIDAYMTGKMEFGSLGGEPLRVPRQMPADAPFVNVYSQSELMTDVLDGVPAPADSDQPRVRFYELTGVPHMRPADLGTEEVEQLPAEIGKGRDPTCMHIYEQEPENVLAVALLDDMDAWVRSGVPMPRADRVVRRGKSVARDPKTHNIIGGVRPAWVQVPAAAYMTDAETNCGLLYDTKIVYGAVKLRALYGTYDNYVRRFEGAKRASVQERYLLIEDASAVRPIATREDFRSEGRSPARSASPVCKPSEYATDTYFPKPAFAGQTRAPAVASHVSYKVETVASGLAHPWSMAFLPDHRMLVTEKTGRLRIVSGSGVLGQPLEGVPALAKFPDGDGGVHDVLLDPQFATNRLFYFTTYEIVPGQAIDPNKTDQPLKGIGRVMRARLSSDERRLEELHTLYEGIGGTRRLALAPDGTLLVSTFSIDAGPAQKLDTNESKVLRIHTDGSIPDDNPWVGKAGVKPEIYALGIRDAEGLTFDRTTGLLWEVEHGPRGGDELNVIRSGRNYGYPIISYGREYSGETINGGLTAKKGLEQPVYFWTPDVAPSGLLIYSGNVFPEWKGDFFVGALATKRLIRLRIKNDGVVREESLLVEHCQRVRDVRQGPEGAIYVLTDEDGGQILRLVPTSKNSR